MILGIFGFVVYINVLDQSDSNLYIPSFFLFVFIIVL